MTEPPNSACGRTRRVDMPGFVVSEFALHAGFGSADHAHSLHGIVLPLAGSLVVTVGATRLAVAEGEALLLPAGLTHGEGAEAPVTCLLLEPADGSRGDSPHLFDRLVRLGHAGVRAAACRLAHALRADPGERWQQEYAAVEVVLQMGQLNVPILAGQDASPPWMTRAAERLRDEFRHPPALGDVAREAGVSREHMARQFRRTTGLPAGEFLRRHRVTEAMRLLRDSRMSLAAIAGTTGYTDQSHLTKHLRRYLGVTPASVRAHRL